MWQAPEPALRYPFFERSKVKEFFTLDEYIPLGEEEAVRKAKKGSTGKRDSLKDPTDREVKQNQEMSEAQNLLARHNLAEACETYSELYGVVKECAGRTPFSTVYDVQGGDSEDGRGENFEHPVSGENIHSTYVPICPCMLSRFA